TAMTRVFGMGEVCITPGQRAIAEVSAKDICDQLTMRFAPQHGSAGQRLCVVVRESFLDPMALGC
ncbi:MAG: hypothetical protein Q8J93_04265, partial [Xanthomonadales bacterium]|nr:hypothetical protein [Xanthomonadales bacterium]